jgi:hypothetical protein
MVSFTLRPLYPRDPLVSKLGGPEIPSGGRGEEKNLAPTGTRNPTPSDVQPVASRYTACAPWII